MYPYRVFLSYSNAERDLATRIATILEEIGFIVLWDHVLVPGQPFTEELKAQISRCHLFIPLLTKKSMVKPWVHQETGYAMGVGVPILPIVIGNIAPVALIQQLQAIRISEDVTQLRIALSESTVNERIEDGAKMGHPNFESIDLPERRTQAIVRYARDAKRRGGGRIRQRSGMTSFSIPDVSPPNPIWQKRDGQVNRSQLLHERLFQERMILGEIVSRHGCDLIIDPGVKLERFGPGARRIRLQLLNKFLLDEKGFPDVRVLVQPRTEPGNILIVGDWFYAESITPQDGVGYKQTLFTWHAPTVLAQIKQFDQQFRSGLEARGIRDERSRFETANIVDEEIRLIGNAAV